MWQAVCLLSCFAVTLGCGTLYTYSAYAPQLSDRLGLSASTISAIGMVGNFSMSLSGPFAGLIVDKQGFLIPIVMSIFCTAGGYSIVYTSYRLAIANVPLLALALFLLGIGSTSAFSASVKCAAVNFPQIRGTATAITMSGYGLATFLMSLISQVTSSNSSDGGHILSVLAILPTLLVCVFGPFVVMSQKRAPSRPVSEEYRLDSPSDLSVERINERPQLEKEVHGLSLVKLPTFWLFFVILGTLAGMGQAYIYTCGYMAKALVASTRDGDIDPRIVAPVQAHQVAILSLANCTGRILSGTFSDTLKSSFRLSRLYSLFLAVVLCFCAMYMARSISSVEQLWIPTILTGLFYGSIFGAFPGIISDSFGVKRLSSNWGLVALAPIPFSSFLAVRIGKIYDAISNASGICAGTQCLQSAYTLHLVLTFMAFMLVVQAIRMEKHYR